MTIGFVRGGYFSGAWFGGEKAEGIVRLEVGDMGEKPSDGDVLDDETVASYGGASVSAVDAIELGD